MSFSQQPDTYYEPPTHYQSSPAATIDAAVDSAASNNYFPIDFNGGHHQNVGGDPVGTAGGIVMRSVATDRFQLAGAPAGALDCKKFLEVTLPLISVGRLCIHGLMVAFNKQGVYVFDQHGTVIAKGRRDPIRNLYLIPVPVQTTITQHRQRVACVHQATEQLSYEVAANAYEIRVIPALITYLHGCAGFIPKPTWIAGINAGFYDGWPGLTAARVRLHLQKSEHTVMGHLKMVSQGLRSTSRPRSKRHPVGVAVVEQREIDTELRNHIGMDLPGRYPQTSTTGHKYIFVMYDYDTGYIKPVAMKSREMSEMLRCFDECYTMFKKAGYTAELIRLDNEVSRRLIDCIEAHKLDYQLVPPGDHRTSYTERAIQCLKNHLISMRSGADPTFKARDWDLMLPQAEITLNISRKSKINPKLSAYHAIHGTFNFNKSPLAPFGMKVIVHDRPDERCSWDDHGSRGFYVGPAIKHYRCYRCVMVKTKAIRISNTVEFFPQHAASNPIMTDAERISMLLSELISIVSKPTRTIPSIKYGNELNDALRTLQKLMCRDEYGQQICEGENIVEQRVVVAPQRPRTRSQQTNAAEPTGTIVRRRFEDKKYYEGEVTKYDSVNDLYTIKYRDGDIEEYDAVDMARFKKKKQQYTPPRHSAYMLADKYDHNIFFIPTKASPNPVKRDYKVKQASILLHHKLEELITNQPSVAYAASGRIWDEELNKLASYRDLILHYNDNTKQQWLTSGENEFGRLFQGFKQNNVEGLNVLNWIRRSAVPSNKKVTYPRYTVAVRPEKDEPNRTRITCGGDRLDYFGDVTTHTASMETIKMHWNSVLSTPKAKYCTGDISNMYLMSTLPEAEYVRFRYDMIPPRIIKQYQLELLAVDGFVYARINKAWYGLKQGGKIAHDDLVDHLRKHGYVRSGSTDGLFKHITRKISFTLVVDDFGIKYERQEDVDHLLKIMRMKYTFKVDMEAKQYIGIHLDWNYAKRELICSMKGYVQQALKELEHVANTRHQYAPSHIDRPNYGARIQYATDDETDTLDESKIKYLQRVVGKFLYYARAIDTTMAHAINDIGAAVANGTEATEKAVRHFLDYAHSNPDGEIIFRASDMILQVDSDAAYLVAPKARSRAGGYHFLGNKDHTMFNGPIHILAKIIKNVMGSAMESEIAAMFMNGQLIMKYREILKDMGHPQPPTRIRTDSQTGCGVVTGKMKQKRTKSVDMNFNWLHDRTVNQKQLEPEWAPGPTNLADYPSKHHPGVHHKNVRPVYLYIKDKSPSTLKGCNELLSQRGRLEDRPARKQIPTVKSLTREHSPMQMEQSTGTFNILDVARKVISELMHKHQLII